MQPSTNRFRCITFGFLFSLSRIILMASNQKSAKWRHERVARRSECRWGCEGESVYLRILLKETQRSAANARKSALQIPETMLWMPREVLSKATNLRRWGSWQRSSSNDSHRLESRMGKSDEETTFMLKGAKIIFQWTIMSIYLINVWDGTLNCKRLLFYLKISQIQWVFWFVCIAQ